MLVNIEWNDYGWREPQIPSNPRFGYSRAGNMPHDTLNFAFDKIIDTSDTIYGFFQPGRGSPRQFINDKSDNKRLL